MAVDPIARAYATVGLRPGVTARELKQQYKRLVRQWHPDRWANDPAGQAEAAGRMRVINAAYAVLQRAQRPVPRFPAGRPLSKAEKDALIEAIGTESPVSTAIGMLVWAMPLAAAVFMLLLRNTR
jgi:hypothetical protein